MKTNVAFVNEVQKFKSHILVLFGNRDHKPEITFYKSLKRPLITFANSGSKFYFVFGCKKIFSSYFFKIFVQIRYTPWGLLFTVAFF